jgi:hypothetical protein
MTLQFYGAAAVFIPLYCPHSPRGEAQTDARVVESQLATLRPEISDGANWVHEIKYDGWRAQAHLDLVLLLGECHVKHTNSTG